MARLLPILALLAPAVAWSHDVELAPLAARIDHVAERASRVRTRARQTGLVPDAAVEPLYDAAMLHWMLGEAEAAASKLWVLRHTLPDEHDLRPSIDEMLTDCLVDIGATGLATNVLHQVLSGPPHPFAADAAARWLLLAARAPADDLAAVYQRLQALGVLESPPPTLAYAIGKARWTLGDRLGAESALRRIPTGHDLGPRARYHLAVIQVAFGELDNAMHAFLDLQQVPDATVSGLARLGIARIHYEYRALDDAARAYRAVPMDSPVRAQALEELAWTELRRGFPDVAEGVIGELTEAYPQSPAVGRMLVVWGRVAMRQQRWDVAEQAFSDAIAHMDAHPPELGTHDATTRAMALLQSLDQTGGLLESARQTSEEIGTSLAQRPSLDRQVDAQRGALEVLGDVATLRLRLLEVEATKLDRAPARALDGQLRELAASPGLAVPTRGWTATRLEALTALEQTIRPQRGHDEGFYEALDALRRTAGTAEADARAVLTQVDGELARRDTVVDRTFTEYTELLRELDGAYGRARQQVGTVHVRAEALDGARRQRAIAEQRSVAAAGIADASWQQLQDLRAGHEVAAEEHEASLRALEAAFRRMRARMSIHESSGGSDVR